MLNADDVVPVPGVEVLAWADHASPDVVWALPARPRLSVAPDGRTEVDLLLYGRRGAAAPMGGQLTMTVDVALTDAERAAAAGALDTRRRTRGHASVAPATAARALPPVEVRAPLWTSAAVHARLADHLALQGAPSLLADDHCLLTCQLDATTAGWADAAWDSGFADATVELRGVVDGVTVTAATACAATAGRATDTGSRTTGAGATVALAARVAATTPKPVSLRLRGPLRLPAAVRARHRTVVDL